MSKTGLAEVTNQIQTVWSPMMMQELRESFILPSIVSKQYEGEIKKQNDTVRISQINAPSSELREVGVNADTFETNQLSTSYVDLKADRRAVSAMEFDDLIQIQSIIDPERSSDIRKALMQDIGNQINDYLYSLLIPSTSSPDHTVNSKASIAASDLVAMRKAASEAHWSRAEEWYALVGPSYYANLLADSTLTDQDYGATDAAMIGGQIVQKRYGFNILEDDSKALTTTLHALTPSALLYAAQTEVRFKISDQHSNKRFGYLLSADIVFGAKLGINGASRSYLITSAS